MEAKGMKEARLRGHMKCSCCDRPVGHAGPVFWSISAERHIINHKAVERRDALGVLVGSQALGAVMGPDEDLTFCLGRAVDIAVCEDCLSSMHRLFHAALVDIEDKAPTEESHG